MTNAMLMMCANDFAVTFVAASTYT